MALLQSVGVHSSLGLEWFPGEDEYADEVRLSDMALEVCLIPNVVIGRVLIVRRQSMFLILIE
jgi:hypothetical protein